MKSSVGIESPEKVASCKAKWPTLPLDMIVIEYSGTGDMAFGGTADDRPLGKDGNILARPYTPDQVATFATIEEAHLAALAIANRREGSLLGVAPRWR